MRNSSEKRRDIARSVLPSTMCVKQTRHQIHKSERARVRQFLHEGNYDGLVPDRVDARTMRGIKEMVSDRRRSDKTSQLIRWALHRVATEKTLADATHEERLKEFASVLPDTLAGRHALTHIESVIRPDRYWVRSGRRVKYVDERIAQIEKAAATIIAAGCHAEFNSLIRRKFATFANPLSSAPIHRPRYLRGAHDVSMFAAATAGAIEGAISRKFAAELRQNNGKGPRS